MVILTVKYDSENPLCSIVFNIRKMAKEEVFKDIETFVKEFDIEYNVMLDSEKWNELKQRQFK